MRTTSSHSTTGRTVKNLLEEHPADPAWKRDLIELRSMLAAGGGSPRPPRVRRR